MTITSSGIVRDKRVHILKAKDWSSKLGTDYWFFPGGEDLLGVSQVTSADPGVAALSDFDWTTTSLILAQSSAASADFLTAATESANLGMQFNGSGDLLLSPRLFGNYSHARAAQVFLGTLPTKLTLEVYGRFVTSSANETTSGFGFIEDSGTPATAGDHLAYIYSDSSNYGLRSGAASDAGAAVDTTNHLWTIEITASGVEWFIDGTSQGSIALETGEFPVTFGAHTFTTNRLMLGWAHIWYE